jgi:endonuclease YncB( thermonuclease family)
MKLLIAFAALALASAAHGETVAGLARVIDGDTINIDGRSIRLFGIDAPEADQTCILDGKRWACGTASTDELSGVIGDQPVECVGDESDTYGRLLAVCQAGRYNLNRTMVQYGWAVAFRRYSDAYVDDEIRAKGRNQGLWKSTFDLPEAHRLAQRTSADETRLPQPAARVRQSSVAGAQGCVIKGNRNRRGQWIYHLPGMPYYEATRPEEMFCTEGQAQAAGYRRAIVR